MKSFKVHPFQGCTTVWSTLLSTALVLGSWVASPPMAWSTQAIEEIVATAEEREGSLQEVPIAMSAFTGDFPEKSNVNDRMGLLQFSRSLGLRQGAAC